MLLTTGKLLTSKQWGQHQDLTSYEDWGLPFWIWLFNKSRDCIGILSVCCWLIQMLSSFKVTSLESCNTEWAWNIHNLVISAWWIICWNICPCCPLLERATEYTCSRALILTSPVNGWGSESVLSMCQSVCLGVCLSCMLEHYGLHSPDWSFDSRWNSNLSLLHWIDNSTQIYNFELSLNFNSIQNYYFELNWQSNAANPS